MIRTRELREKVVDLEKENKMLRELAAQSEILVSITNKKKPHIMRGFFRSYTVGDTGFPACLV